MRFRVLQPTDPSQANLGQARPGHQSQLTLSERKQEKNRRRQKIEVLVLDRVPHRQLDHLRSRRLLLLQQVCI